jgi:hypothetical protein
MDTDTDQDFETQTHVDTVGEGRLQRRVLTGSLLMLVVFSGVAVHSQAPKWDNRASHTNAASQTESQAMSLLQLNLQTQSRPFHPVGNFIAAMGGTNSRSGSGAEKWGLWVGDPGSDGRYPNTLATNPPAWYDSLDWWKEEHGLIMPNPKILPAGEYKVYGDTTEGGPKVLTVDGNGHWTLPAGVTLDDVTHHPCKAFRYMGTEGSGCDASSEAKCTDDGSPVEYKVLIVSEQTVSAAPTGVMPKP